MRLSTAQFQRRSDTTFASGGSLMTDQIVSGVLIQKDTKLVVIAVDTRRADLKPAILQELRDPQALRTGEGEIYLLRNAQLK